MASNTNYFAMIDDDNDFEMWQGLRGPAGPAGPAGKSAYEAAQEGGYTGSEAQFNAALAEVDTALQPSDVDTELSPVSTNPVQNRAVYEALAQAAIKKTVTGNPVTFYGLEAAENLYGLKVNIKAVQAAGTPSPDNKIPISGWNNVRIWNKATYDPTLSPTATIALSQVVGQAVYGGTLNVKTGKLVIDYDYEDGFDYSAARGFSTRNGYTTAFISYQGVIVDPDAVESTICDSFVWDSTEKATGFSIYVGSNSTSFYFTLPGELTAEQWRARMTEIHPMIVGKIATPVEVDLTPLEVAVLVGQTNNVWADAGTVTVTFAANEIEIDGELSDTSENPVQNKVITEALENVSIPVDNQLNLFSANPVENRVISNELALQSAELVRQKSALTDFRSQVADRFQKVLSGTTKSGYYFAATGMIENEITKLAVYSVDPGGVYKVAKVADGGANQFRLAFGNTAPENISTSTQIFGYLDRKSYSEQVVDNVFGCSYLYVYFAFSQTPIDANDALICKKYDPSVLHYTQYTSASVDFNNITADSGIVFSSTNTISHAPISGKTCYLNTKKTLNNIVFQELWYHNDDLKYFRFRATNGTWSDWAELETITDKKHPVTVYYSAPSVGKSEFDKKYFSRTKILSYYSQDIAVYNGTVFDFAEGKCSVNGADVINIQNGHGNNAMFGKTLHGSYPYLYCGNWVKDDAKVYVNQYANGEFTLIDTISFSGLTGYANCCVDEANQRVYMLVAKTSPELGDIDFVVGDFSGNIISEKSVGYLPYIEGMTWYDGKIIVSAGHSGVPSSISVYDEEGNLLSKTSRIDTYYPLEGIDVDGVTSQIYIATTNEIWI